MAEDSVAPDDLVSIIVPAFNHEAYVLECLHSVHAQTHRALELVFIDDGSSDGTFERARALLATSFGRRFWNVVARRKEKNSGAHDSLNIGLQAATADVIAIINSDDCFLPDRIAALRSAMRDTGAQLAMSLVDTIDDSTTAGNMAKTRGTAPDPLLLLRLRQEAAASRDLSIGYALLRGNIGVTTGNLVFTKDLARRIGPFQPLRYCHDWDFLLQSVVHAEPLLVGDVLYQYRLHGANAFRSYRHLAELETEVVLRRWLRAILQGPVANPHCPSPETFPGVFEAFLLEVGLDKFWAKEVGDPLPGWRTYEANGRRRPRDGAVRSVEAAFRLFAQSRASASGTSLEPAPPPVETPPEPTSRRLA